MKRHLGSSKHKAVYKKDKKDVRRLYKMYRKMGISKEYCRKQAKFEAYEEHDEGD